MANLRIVPGAQVSTFKISNISNLPGQTRELRVAGEVSSIGGVNRKKLTAIDEAQTPGNVYVQMHSKGSLTVTPLADQDLGFLDGLLGGLATVAFLNGKIITMTNFTNMTEDGVSTNHTTGVGGELTFGYDAIQQATPTN